MRMKGRLPRLRVYPNEVGIPSSLEGAQGSRSFPCPGCGGKTAVYDSRPNMRTIRRRRACIACGKRFKTVEQHTEMTAAVDDLPRMLAQQLRELADRVEAICSPHPDDEEAAE